MNNELFVAFVITSLVLIVVPGPSVLLILSVSLARGTRAGVFAVLGTSVAMAAQLLVAVAGLATAMIILSEWLDWLRWLGIAWLVYLGLRHWFDPGAANKAALDAETIGFWQGFLVALTNPQTMLFFAAYLPQFVDARLPVTRQLAVLAITFWFLALVIDLMYTQSAARLRPVLSSPKLTIWRGRIIGLLFLAAALALALVPRPVSS